MVELNFDVKVDLVMNGRIVPPSALGSSGISGSPSGPGAELLGMVQSTDIQGFYLAAWIGAGSQEFSLSRINESGEASVRKFNVKSGDVDTLKFAVAFKQETRCCHLASSFITINELQSVLDESVAQRSSSSKFTSSQRCLALKDNFTANKAVVRFSSSSGFPSLLKQKYRQSSLSSLDETNDAVGKLGVHIQQSIMHCAISPLNAGVQFIDSYTFGNMSNHMTHYALLGYLFKNMGSPVDLKMVMYDAYQAMHSMDLSFDALDKMPNSELALRFGISLITKHTACEESNKYRSDKTVNALGQVCSLRETEDIARTFSALAMGVRSDLDESVYAGSGQSVSGLSLAMAIDQLDRSGVTRMCKKSGLGGPRISKALEVDDCENLSMGNMLKAKGILNAFETYGARGLAAQMSKEAKGSPLFANCTDAHHTAMARTLVRLGSMLKSGDWDISFLVASAKSASYSLDDPGSASCLSGHGAGITRVRDSKTGQFIHAAVEGTTYATVDRPMPEGYPSMLPIKLQGQCGEPDKVVPMNTAELLTSLGQNINRELGLSPSATVQAHFLPEYKDAQECPFYVSAFYTGLSEGSTGSIACVPVDTCPSPHYLAGEKPLFGAPVMGLSKPSTMAIPISTETFSDAGVKEPERILKLMADQVEEAWPPYMTQKQKDSLMSFWQPVASPDLPKLTSENYTHHLRSENCWAYDDPHHTALAVKVLSGLAQRFNEIQAKDPASDGSRAVAFGQYLSATLRITMPVPKNTKGFSLSSMRNIRKAADDIGIRKLSSCPIKAKMINARASIKSDHAFYMCDKGEGFVHSYNSRLA
jgi:hypothetical protein